MADKMSPQQRHDCMSHIRSADTRPELAVRRELWRRGYRYRINRRSLPGSPDIVLPKYRTAIFVNGCFWHGHRGCPKFVMPSSNREFWQEKIARNRERDLVNNLRLETLAWNMITVWECELSKARLQDTMDRIISQMSANKSKWEEYCRRRREDRRFAREQSRLRREILAQTESEIDDMYNIPPGIRRLSHTEIH